MNIYPANQKKPINVDAPQGPNDEIFYGFKYKPETWQASKVYDDQLHVVVPTVPNGFLYSISSNGTSDATEPTWATVKGQKTTDGTVEFKAVEYNAFLYDAETLTASIWTATDGVPITNETWTADGETQVMIGPIPSGVTSFTITNSVTKNNGEKEARSMIIKVSER